MIEKLLYSILAVTLVGIGIYLIMNALILPGLIFLVLSSIERLIIYLIEIRDQGRQG